MKMKQVGKQILSVLLTVCLVTGSIIITESQKVDAAGSNLVSNGGFDATTDWYDTSDDTEVAMPEQQEVKDVELTEHFANGDFEAEVDYSGTWWKEAGQDFTLQVEDESSGNKVLHASNMTIRNCFYVKVNLEAGTTYTISYDIKTSISTECYYHLFDGSWGWLKQNDKISTNWETRTFTYEPTSAQNVLIFQCPDTTSTEFYIDNFSVTTESPKMAVTEHFTNGDFEAEVDYSGTWWKEAGQGFALQVEDEGSGNKVLHASNMTTANCFYVKVNLEAGTTYTISYDIKTSISTGCYYHLFDGSWGWLKQNDKISTNWTTRTFTYEPTSAQSVLIFQCPDATSTEFYIDNFSVTTESPKMAVTEHFTNGNFENTEYDYSITWWPDQNSTLNIENEGTGNRVLHASNIAAGECLYAGVQLETGKTYTISFDVKTSTTANQRDYHLFSGDWQWVEDWNKISTNWETHTWEYTPASAQSVLIFQNPNAGDLYIDNFSVTSMETPITYSEGIGNCLGAESDNVLAMKEMTEATYKNVSLTAGNTYKYSYQVKTDNAASVTFAAGTQTVQTTAATSDWTTVSGKFTAEADAAEISFVRSGAGNLLIDDVEMYEIVKPVDHTTMEGGGAYIPAGHKNLLEGSTSSFADANHENGIVGTVTVADGIAELAINNNTTWVETKHIAVEAGKEYTFSAYVYVTEATGDLQINLYTGGAGCSNASWVDYALGEANSLTTNSEGWQLVQFTWTPQQSGPVYFGIKNYGTASTATVYVDDFALTTAKGNVQTTISKANFYEGTGAYSLFLNVSNYDELCTDLGEWSWLDGEILIDGKLATVGFNLGSGTLTTWYDANQNPTAVIPLTATSIEIPVGTEFVVRNDSSKPVLVIENDLKMLKLGQVWEEYQKEHVYVSNGDYADGENVRYYNISNGDYLITSSNNAIEVAENKALTTGDKITVNDLKDTNVFHISRIENEELWKETVVLYIPGDANEDEAISAKDLVAMKWAETKTSDKQNARLAGTYAADLDGNRDVSDIDLRALRLALVSDDAEAELAVSKSDSLLGGEMPIAGFDMPHDSNGSEQVNDSLYQLIADAGINTIVWSFDGYDSGVGVSADKHMALADKWGLKMWVHDYSTDAASTNRFTRDNFANRIGAYSMFESFAGVHIVDEPDLEENGLLAVKPERLISIFKNDIALCNETANISGYMNLFPYYPHLTEQYPNLTTDKYKNYLTQTFTETKAEMLSVDHYPIRIDEGSFLWWDTSEKAKYESNFYQNLDMMRTEVNKEENAGKPFWYYAQLGIDVATDKEYDTDLYMTTAELQWEVNTALALGARGIQYWSVYADAAYKTMAENGYSGLVKPDGTKSNYYDSTKAQNSFIKVVDEVLMNATNEGIFVNDSTAKTAFNEMNSGVILADADSDVLKSVSGDNALVGCFDYYGKTAFYVVNCNTGAAQNITLNYDNACQAAVTKFTDTTLNRTLSEAASSTTISVGAGQAALVIVE